jgi:DNA invertase Pin-like site-specific DNA recombinase
VVVIYAKGRASNALRDYAASRGWDDGVWAVSEPAALLRAVRAGKVEIVLASSLNGLARSSLELVELLKEFVSLKITLIIPSQGIDTAKVPRKAFLGMLDAIGEFKRAAVTDRIRAGLIAARKRGARLGRPQTVNVHRGDVARLRARGLTGRAIAKELRIPSSTVFKLIKGDSVR